MTDISNDIENIPEVSPEIKKIKGSSHSPNKAINWLAQALTLIFNPFLLPIYSLLIIFSSPTLFSYLSKEIKHLLFIIVLIDNCLVPFILFSYMKARNFISDWLVYNRAERIVPIFTSALFYALTLYIIYRFNIPGFIKVFFLAAFVMTTCIGIVSFFMKSSIHAGGMGALIALVVVLSIKTQVPLTGYLITTILLTGIVMSARLWLNAHSVKEIWVGLSIGFFGTGLILYFF